MNLIHLLLKILYFLQQIIYQLLDHFILFFNISIYRYLYYLLLILLYLYYNFIYNHLNYLQKLKYYYYQQLIIYFIMFNTNSKYYLNFYNIIMNYLLIQYIIDMKLQQIINLFFNILIYQNYHYLHLILLILYFYLQYNH